MMRRELRIFRLGGKSSKSDGLKIRRNKNRCWFPDLGFQLLVSYVGIGLNLDGLLANHLNTTR